MISDAPPTVVWLRDDLRLADNPALAAAAARGPVVALFVLDEKSAGVRPLGAAARWWLHHSLVSLAARLASFGVPLVLRRGAAGAVVRDVVSSLGAGAVMWNRRYAGAERAVDAELKSGLRTAGVEVQSFAASLLFEPWTVQTGSGTHYSVFTPFWRACQSRPAPRQPLPEPENLHGGSALPTDDLDEWNLLPTTPDWAAGLRATWEPGEPAALARLHEFVTGDLADYDRTRDEPSTGSTSMLSPRLRWGEISPFTAWHAAADVGGSARFLSELGWREFAWHTLFHFPELATKNLRSEFDAFPWPDVDLGALAAWREGNTGFGIVDAGMHELWQTGHMHNRVRMITASFLVKNLLIDWRVGEQWFWDTLVDADAASNPFNWQWVAGSGADAAPYFRIFNPELQRKKFDPQGSYVRQWAPGASPPQIVELTATRRVALAAYDVMKRST